MNKKNCLVWTTEEFWIETEMKCQHILIKRVQNANHWYNKVGSKNGEPQEPYLSFGVL